MTFYAITFWSKEYRWNRSTHITVKSGKMQLIRVKCKRTKQIRKLCNTSHPRISYYLFFFFVRATHISLFKISQWNFLRFEVFISSNFDIQFNYAIHMWHKVPCLSKFNNSIVLLSACHPSQRLIWRLCLRSH